MTPSTNTEANKGVFFNSQWVFVAIITILLVLSLWQIRAILLYMLAAVIVVVLFTMPIRFLHRRFGLGRTPAILISAAGFIVLVVAFSLVVFPTLFTQFSRLTTETIPRGLEQLIAWWNSGQAFEQFPFLEDSVKNFRITDQLVNEVVGQLSTALGQLGGSVLPLVGGVASTLLSLLIILFLSGFFLAEPQRYVNGMIRITPIWYRVRMREILTRIDDAIRAWLRVTGASMLVAGIGTGLGLAVLGINEWFALGVLTGAFSFIPNFGSIAALIPAIAVGILQVPQSIGWIIIIVYGVSFVQSQIVSPILASENMNMPPVMILVGQIVFGIFFGFLGIMLAVPMTAIAMILVDEIYVKDILGDRGQDDKSKHVGDELLPDGT